MAGNVYCWGWNPFGELGLGSTTLSQNCTDGVHTAPCTATPMQVALSNVAILRAGGAVTCAIDTLYHAYCWGDNDEGEIGDGDSSGNYVSSPAEVTDTNSVALTFDDISVGFDKVCAREGGARSTAGGAVRSERSSRMAARRRSTRLRSCSFLSATTFDFLAGSVEEHEE